MMWHPDEAAFRVGQVTADQWDSASIGRHSFAAGLDTVASGENSVAFDDESGERHHYDLQFDPACMSLTMTGPGGVRNGVPWATGRFDVHTVKLEADRALIGGGPWYYRRETCEAAND